MDILAGNSVINEKIHRSLASINPQDARSFERKFRSEKGIQLQHSYRELLVGSYLHRNGFAARSEPIIDGITPDWAIVGKNDDILCIVEAVSYEIDQRTTEDIIDQLKRFPSAGYFIPTGCQYLAALLRHR